MSYIFANPARSDTLGKQPLSKRCERRGLADAVERDLSTLRLALPKLCRRLTADPRNYTRVLNASAEAADVSLLPSLDALGRLWTASRLKVLGRHRARVAWGPRTFTSRLLDVCEHALEMSLLALKHGHFEAGNQNILRDLEALVHILQVSSTIVLWQVKWCLRDGGHCTPRHASALRLILELQQACPKGAVFEPRLQESRCQLVLACLLCAAKLETMGPEQIHRACNLLQSLPRSVLLRCFGMYDEPSGSCVVFAFNDVCLAHVNAASEKLKMRIDVGPVQEYFHLHPTDGERLCYEDHKCLTLLLDRLRKDGVMAAQSIRQMQSTRVAVGINDILSQRHEWLEFIPAGSDRENQGTDAEVVQSYVGTLRVNHRPLLRHHRGDVATIQLKPQGTVSLCLITDVHSEAGLSNRLNLELLSTNWFIDHIQPLTGSWERLDCSSRHAILAQRTDSENRRLMIVEVDLRFYRLQNFPTHIRLRSSGVTYARVGQPRIIGGAICAEVEPLRNTENSSAISLTPMIATHE